MLRPGGLWDISWLGEGPIVTTRASLLAPQLLPSGAPRLELRVALRSQGHGESDEGREAVSCLVGKTKGQILGDALLRGQGREGT